MPWKRIASLALFFAVVGLALYARVIVRGPFLFDDAEYVLDNQYSRDIVAALSLNDARQLGYLSFAVNYVLGGEVPTGYHLVNVVIHIVNSLLAVLLVLSLLRRLNSEEALPAWTLPAALFTGMLFLVHPLQTQAVSYITQRFTSLGTLWYLLSVLLYLAGRRSLEGREQARRGALCMLGSLLSTIAAMRTKEIAVTIPLMLLLLELLLYRGSRLGRKRFLLLLPFAAALAIIPLTIFGPELGMSSAIDGKTDVIRTDKIHDLTQRSPLQYLYTQTRVIVVYLRLLVLPVGQRVIYDLPLSTGLLEPAVLASSLVLALLGAGGWFSWKRYVSSGTDGAPRLAYGLAAIGVLWFFVTLSVESSVLPIKDVIFEHRVYLPSFGFFAAASAVMAYGASVRLAARPDSLKLLALVILLPLSIGTVLRNEVWTDDLRFWNDVIRKAPRKAVGYNNRATVLAQREEYGRALEDFDRAIALFPRTAEELFQWENADYSPWNMSKTYTGRGNVNLALGRLDRAEEDFRRAKEVFSMPVDAENLLLEGDALSKAGRYRDAVWIYDRVLEWDPRDVRALNDRANAYTYLGRFPEAINDLTRVIALEPTFIVAYHNRAFAYAWAGKTDRAVEDFRTACGKGFEPACGNVDAVPLLQEQRRSSRSAGR